MSQYRNLIDGVWFGLSMLAAGCVVGAVAYAIPIYFEFPPFYARNPERDRERFALGMIGGAIAGGMLWKIYESTRKPLPNS